jgi:putative two-component system response regulator
VTAQRPQNVIQRDIDEPVWKAAHMRLVTTPRGDEGVTPSSAMQDTALVQRLVDLSRSVQPDDLGRARQIARQALEIARSINDVVGEAGGVYRLASIAFFDGDAQQALSLALDARGLARRAGAPVVEAWALNLIGLVHLNAGNHDQALARCLEALDACRRSGDRSDEGTLLNAIALIHERLGDLDRARATYADALRLADELHADAQRALTLTNLAHVHLTAGDYEQVVLVGRLAIELCNRYAPLFEPEALAFVAQAHDALGEHDDALELFDRALAAHQELIDGGGEVSLTADIEILLARGRGRLTSRGPAAAIDDLCEALRRAEESNQKALAMEAHGALLRAYKEAGRVDRALFHAEARFALHQELFNAGTDARIRTLQVTYDTENSRQQTESLQLRTSELEEMVRKRTSDLEAYQIETLERLAILGEFRDTDTGEHTVRVGDMCGRLAKTMGLDQEYCDRLQVAARLHDIGKVGIPDSILLKPGPLTADEFEIMKTHTTIGALILSGSSSPLVQIAEEVALNHHERWDGGGYPNGHHGDAIPLSGRICTVADVFDALTSERPYKRAWALDEAVRYIARAAGTQFDPAIVDAFLDVMSIDHPEIEVPLVAEPLLTPPQVSTQRSMSGAHLTPVSSTGT